MLFGLSPQWQAGIVMGSWTIGVEMLFYVMFPLLALCVRSLRAQLFVLAASYALALWAAHGWPAPLNFLGNGYGLLTQMPIFVLGCVIFRVWQRSVQLAPRRQQVLGLGLLALGVIGNVALFYRWLPSNDWVNVWHLSAVGYGLILLGLLLVRNRVVLALLVNRATCFLGTISYSLYLVHPFLVSRLYGVFARAYAALPDGAAYLACLGLSLAASIPAAWLTYRFVEKPGIRLGHRVFARWQARKRAASVSVEAGA
jgi:peptidoglycan/LPS O-acetylase OafA/YrhL